MKRPITNFIKATLLICTIMVAGAIGYLAKRAPETPIYVFDEIKFYKIISVAMAQSSSTEQEKTQEDGDNKAQNITAQDKANINDTVLKLKHLLANKYSNPGLVIITSHIGRIRFLKTTKVQNITDQVIREIIGEERWKSLESIFSAL